MGIPDQLIKQYRKCVLSSSKAKYYPGSAGVPAFIRYEGVFYRTIWSIGGAEFWLDLLGQRPCVLVLSALYGFISPAYRIKIYNISLSQVPGACKAVLPRILERIIVESGVENVYFFTSRTYYQPFTWLKNRYNVYRVRILDPGYREIVGRYGSDYYREAALLFTSIFSDNIVYSGSGKYVELK